MFLLLISKDSSKLKNAIGFFFFVLSSLPFFSCFCSFIVDADADYDNDKDDGDDFVIVLLVLFPAKFISGHAFKLYSVKKATRRTMRPCYPTHLI